MQQVPDEALAGQRAAATDERELSFAGLSQAAASGPAGDDGGLEWLRRLGVERPVTVRDVAARA